MIHRLDGSSVTERGTAPAPTTRIAGVARDPSSRCSTSLHTSGTGTRASDANRSRRSSIAVTQKLAEPSPTATQVGADGEAVRAEAGRDVADREVRVVERDPGGPLGVWQSP